MYDLFAYDPLLAGTKGIVFIGDKILAYRRDTNTKLFPLYLDLPGGGREGNETPFATFQRELDEEFGLTVRPEDISWWRRYISVPEPSKYTFMLAAHLPAETEQMIRFGDEGIEWMLISVDEFMSRDDTWPVLKERVADYLASKKN